MLQPSLRTAGDICRPALYGIYLLEATANRLTSRSRRRRKMLAKAKRRRGRRWKWRWRRVSASRRSTVIASRDNEGAREREDFMKLLCAACASDFGGGLALTRFSIHLHMDMYACVCVCVCMLDCCTWRTDADADTRSRHESYAQSAGLVVQRRHRRGRRRRMKSSGNPLKLVNANRKCICSVFHNL